MTQALTTERQQFAEQNEMTMDFVNWFFDHKKESCGNAWFMMAAAMWEGWKEAPANREAQPVGSNEFIPKNLDKALAVVGLAIPESREEFNFQTERWVQRLIDRVIRYSDELTAPPAPAVPRVTSIPDAATLTNINQLCPIDSNLSQTDFSTGWNDCRQYAITHEGLPPVIKGVHAVARGWNACRAAMLAADSEDIKDESSN